MEVRSDWTYETFPEFTEEVEGAVWVPTTGDEIGANCLHDVEYLNIDGYPLHLQICLPNTRNPHAPSPCMIHVQGSAWFYQNRWDKVTIVERMVEKGYAVVIVQYRHSEIAPFPAQAQDARNAIRFMKVHAEEYNIDPERIIISGDSSGGHTSMLAGLIKDGEKFPDGTPFDDDTRFPGVSASVKGIINMYGSISMQIEDGYPTTVNHHLPDSPEGMEMGAVNLRENPELRKKGSVETYVTEDRDMVPTFLTHGTKDFTVNCIQTVMLYRKMKEQNKDVRLYLIQGAKHGGAEFWTPEQCDRMDEFMKYCFSK